MRGFIIASYAGDYRFHDLGIPVHTLGGDHGWQVFAGLYVGLELGGNYSFTDAFAATANFCDYHQRQRKHHYGKGQW